MMDYTDLAIKICDEMLNYQVTNESIYEVYNIIFEKYAKEFISEKNYILVKVIHYITISGYDIDCIKPMKFKKFMN